MNPTVIVKHNQYGYIRTVIGQIESYRLKKSKYMPGDYITIKTNDAEIAIPVIVNNIISLRVI